MTKIAIGFLVVVIGGLLWLSYSALKIMMRNHQIKTHNQQQIADLVKDIESREYPSKPRKPTNW